MTRKNMVSILLILAILINIGVWLMGVYGIEIHAGSHVLGRHISINEEETYGSLLGWFIVIGATVTMFVVLYRNR